MLVLLAPDSFKGSLTATDAARAMARGARSALPHADLATYPMADGGEGTLDALATSGALTLRTAQAIDPVGRPRTARWGSGAGGNAIVELAEASGLPLLAGHLAPLTASTRGTGMVLAEALAAGARDILLCLGGSASTDGGAGILRALGARLIDASGDEVHDGGASLASIVRIDVAGLAPAARAARWRLACDVRNPLTGPRGAAAVFAPQKGATPEDVAELDAALAHWARLLARDVGPLDPGAAGVGAAGGTPSALIAAFGAELAPGARLVADAIGLTARLGEADALVTGEGTFDASSLGGKVVGTLADLARSADTPTFVLAGAVKARWEDWGGTGIVGVRSIADGPRDLASLIADAAPLLEAATRDTLTTWSAPHR
jgi:glycerate kinase